MEVNFLVVLGQSEFFPRFLSLTYRFLLLAVSSHGLFFVHACGPSSVIRPPVLLD